MPALPKLSVLVMTRDSETRLAATLDSVRGIADEIVVYIDATTTDRTEDVARAVTDRVFRFAHDGAIEPHQEAAVRSCRGDWVLRLDDDERISGIWTHDILGRMLAEQSALGVAAIYLLKRWIVPPGDRFIVSPPWWKAEMPLRLFRNLPDQITWADQIHTALTIPGQAVLTADAVIDHYDLVINDRAARERKVARYERLAPGRSQADLYLFEDQTFATAPLRPWTPAQFEIESSGDVA